ncbi:MAG: hypothetical protein K0R78_3655 [Pelosinus sp.]|nr:hypothetical protein [Pelosinus sp.]
MTCFCICCSKVAPQLRCGCDCTTPGSLYFWCAREDSNHRLTRFRKPPLYPPELRAHVPLMRFSATSNRCNYRSLHRLPSSLIAKNGTNGIRASDGKSAISASSAVMARVKITILSIAFWVQHVNCQVVGVCKAYSHIVQFGRSDLWVKTISRTKFFSYFLYWHACARKR